MKPVSKSHSRIIFAAYAASSLYASLPSSQPVMYSSSSRVPIDCNAHRSGERPWYPSSKLMLYSGMIYTPIEHYCSIALHHMTYDYDLSHIVAVYVMFCDVLTQSW